MTFWNLLTGLGFSFAVAALVNALISRDAQLALFNSEPGNLGIDCTLFIDNTIFRFCGRTLLSWRPLVISLSMFSTALIVLVLAGLWRSPDRTNFLHFFIEPFQPLSVSTTLVAFFCLTVIVIADYLSFVQTFLLMRYAARTFSFIQIAFLAYTDIILTISSLIFVGSAVLTALYFYAIYQPFGYASITMEIPLMSKDELKTYSFGGSFGGVEAEGAFAQTLFLVNSGNELDESTVKEHFEKYLDFVHKNQAIFFSAARCRNWIDNDKPDSQILRTTMVQPWIYTAFHSATRSPIQLFSENFQNKTEYDFPYSQYLTRSGGFLIRYSYFTPLQLFTVAELTNSIRFLYSASFGILQNLQLGMLDFANTFFQPEALTSQSWCSMSNYMGALTFDPSGQHVSKVHMMWTMTESSSDTGGKAATSILADKLFTNWINRQSKNYKDNYSLCDGKVEYISTAEVGKLSNCTESIFVVSPESEDINMARLAQFVLLAKGHVFLGPFFLATFASTFAFYGALYSFLFGRFLLR